MHDLLFEGPRVGHAIKAGDGRDDQHVATPGEERSRGAQAELVDFLIDSHILLDVRVGGGQVSLGLIVVVVGNEVLDGVLREEGLEFAVELGGQRLVVTQNERGFADPLHDVCDGERFAGAGDAEKGLIRHAALDAPR